MSPVTRNPSVAREVIAALRSRVTPLARGAVTFSTWNDVLAGAVYGRPYSAALAAERDGKLPEAFAPETAKSRSEATSRLAALARLPIGMNPFVAADADQVASAMIDLVPGRNESRTFDERLGSWAEREAGMGWEVQLRNWADETRSQVWSGRHKSGAKVAATISSGGSPVLLGVRIDTGEPFALPRARFDRNMLVTGQHGTGVGQFVRLVEAAAVARGDRVMVMDRNDELPGAAADTTHILRGCCARAGRGASFRHVDFGAPEQGDSYNPILEGADCEQIAVRIVNALLPPYTANPGAEYYARQYVGFLAARIRLVRSGGREATLENLLALDQQIEGVPPLDFGGLRLRMGALRDRPPATLLNSAEPRVRMRAYFDSDDVVHLRIPPFMFPAVVGTPDVLACLTLSDYCAALDGVVRGPSKRCGLTVLSELPSRALAGRLQRIFERARSAGERIVVESSNLADLEVYDASALRSVFANTPTKVVFRPGTGEACAALSNVTGVPEADLASLDVGEAYVVEVGEAPVRIRVAGLAGA